MIQVTYTDRFGCSKGYLYDLESVEDVREAIEIATSNIWGWWGNTIGKTYHIQKV